MLSAILSLAAPAILGPAGLGAIASPMIASAIGGGLGALLEGRKGGDVLQAAALGGLGSALAGGMSAPAGTTANLATSSAAPTAVATNPDIASKMFAGSPNLPANVTAADLGKTPFLQNQATSMLGPTPTFTEALMSKPALAAGAATGLGLPPITPEFKKDEGPEPPEGMAPVGKPRVAPIGFDPGKEGEFDYRIPRNFQEGGLASLEMDATEMNDKELINKAIDAIQNELPNPEEVLGVFIARFGEEALADLVRKVQDGTFDDTVERSEGMIDGMGDGMDDMVPAKLEGQDDVLLSDGEFIVPADVVSGLGNGSSKAGSDRLYDMMDRVRQMRTGTTEQPDDVPTEQMMPA
jgi:hypothetical protein